MIQPQPLLVDPDTGDSISSTIFTLTGVPHAVPDFFFKTSATVSDPQITILTTDEYWAVNSPYVMEMAVSDSNVCGATNGILTTTLYV